MSPTPPPARGGFEPALQFLTNEILAGRLRPGSRLPSERDLAVELGVGRGAVREALRVLQAQGLVTASVGQAGGTWIASTQGSSFGRILRLHLALHSVSHDELTETRVLLERAATEAATRTAGPEDLAHLQDLCRDMHEVDDVAGFNDLDTQFHVGIAQAAQNRLVRDLTIAVREAVSSHILTAEQRLGERWGPLRTALVAEHESILEAIRSGDGRLAAERAEQHVRQAHVALLDPTR